MSTYPALTSLEEVIGFLNATGPDSNSNYLVYGLSVSSNSVQAYVDHANTYIGSLVPTVTSTDPRYSFAQLAALDLACMSVLVAASGGMLLGAADYKLGDLFVTKGTIGKFSFKVPTKFPRNFHPKHNKSFNCSHRRSSTAGA